MSIESTDTHAVPACACARIKQLTKNPRKSFRKISETVEASPSTIQRRFEQLKKDRVILRATTIIDLSKIGFAGKKIIFITGSKNFDLKTVTKKLSKVPNIFQISSGLGCCDLVAIGVFKKVLEIEKMLKEIRLFPSIKNVKVAITSNTQFPVTTKYSKIHLGS
jgi:DNA-binding Lrp family transcriptional regulator